MPWPKGVPQRAESIAKRIASLAAGGTRRKKPVMIDGVEHWRCSGCERDKSASEYYSDRRAPNGLKAHCKACHQRATLAARNPDKHADANRDYMRRIVLRDPGLARTRWRKASALRERTEQIKARELANRAIARGELVRPTICPACLRPAKVQAHHHDYSRPLDVDWLCAECHGLAHRRRMRPRKEHEP